MKGRERKASVTEAIYRAKLAAIDKYEDDISEQLSRRLKREARQECDDIFSQFYDDQLEHWHAVEMKNRHYHSAPRYKRDGANAL